MRKLLAVLTVVCLAAPALAGLSVGDTIRFYDREGTTGGGEYGVALAGPTANPELFRTFCVQVSEFLDFNRAGFNVADITNHSEVVGGNTLTPYTAYLYTQFSSRSLSGYDYAAGTAAHIGDANSLQRAIWLFEGEIAGVGSDLQAAAWVKEAVNAVGVGFGGYSYAPRGPATWGTTLGQVRVLNLTWASSRYANAGRAAQDVLYFVPDGVPMVDAPSAALLGVIGLGLAAWAKRRLS
jgi:hypothetical protein